MSTQVKTYLTPEEYLALERRAETKSEYFNGEMFAMVGASREHNVVSGNIFREINQQLRGTPCESYTSDMRVRIPATGLYTYPDVIVVCGEPEFDDDQVDTLINPTLINPTLIVEVLSGSTESYDRGKKFGHYRSVESITEYLLVAQDECRIEQFVKQTDGRWLLSEAGSLDGSLQLASVPCVLLLKEVYDRIAFA